MVKQVLFWWCLVILAVGQTAATRAPHSRSRLLLRRKQALNSDPPVAQCQYTEHYFSQTLDHFNASDQRSFQQRYLVYDKEWLITRKGPIMLYTGNEGDIVWFCNNTVC